MRYAQDTGKRVFVIRDPAVDGKLSHPPFQVTLPKRNVFDDVAGLDNPHNQQKILQKVAGELEKNATKFTKKRFRKNSSRVSAAT